MWEISVTDLSILPTRRIVVSAQIIYLIVNSGPNQIREENVWTHWPQVQHVREQIDTTFGQMLWNVLGNSKIINS